MCFLFQAIFARCHQRPISTLEVAEMCWLRHRHTVFVDLRYMVSRHWWLMNGPTKTACSSLIICSDLDAPNSDSWCWTSCEIIGKLLHVHILYYIFLPHHLDIRCFTAKSTQNEISSCLLVFSLPTKDIQSKNPSFRSHFFPKHLAEVVEKLEKKQLSLLQELQNPHSLQGHHLVCTRTKGVNQDLAAWDQQTKICPQSALAEWHVDTFINKPCWIIFLWTSLPYIGQRSQIWMLIIVNLCIYIEWFFFWNNFSRIQCYRRIKLRSFCCRWNSNSTKRLMRKARGGGTCPSKSRRQKNLTYILNDEKFRKWTFPLFEKSECFTTT